MDKTSLFQAVIDGAPGWQNQVRAAATAGALCTDDLTLIEILLPASAPEEEEE